MTNSENPELMQKNRYIFAAVGAALGGVAGMFLGGGLLTLIAVAVGGALGYGTLDRVGSA